MPETEKHTVTLFNFYSKFKSVSTEIHDALLGDNPDLDALASSTTSLRKSLNDFMENLPSHDKRNYEQDLQSLERKIDALRKASITKPKFSFKRVDQKAKSPVLKAQTSTVSPQTTAYLFADPTFNLTSLSSSTITAESITGLSKQHTALTISDISNSLIDLRTATILLACHVRKITGSAIILPTISGSVILDELENCLLVTQCQQFRMHSSRNITVLLHITSTPIIEASSMLRFGALDPKIPMIPMSQHDQVRDFDCPDSESPNWTILDTQIGSEIIDLLRSPNNIELETLLSTSQIRVD